MSDIETEEFKTYREDKRIPCRYGGKCYQKNTVHHEKYKHPPIKHMKEKRVKCTTISKKRKISDNQSDKSPKHKIQKMEDRANNGDLNNASCATENNNASENRNSCNKDDEGSTISNLKQCTENSNYYITIRSLLTNENINFQNDEINIDNVQAVISYLFLTEMPEDFFQLYEFCQSICEKDPLNALLNVDLQLVGPYDVFRDKFLNFKVENKKVLLRHWRYYYDPPEFQTIIKDSGKDGLHYGYWRDDISEKPVFVAKNKAAVNYLIEPVAENIFGTLDVHITLKLKLASPFEKLKIVQMHQKLKNYAKKNNITLDKKTAKMLAREKQVVARTLHKAGIVVPYNKKTQLGYRDLTVTDSELQKILKQIENPCTPEARKPSLSMLEEIIRLATIAADECDFGTVLELGHDLFSSGVSCIQSKALYLLSLAYTLLQRTSFIEIAQIHLKDRRKTLNPSVLQF